MKYTKQFLIDALSRLASEKEVQISYLNSRGHSLVVDELMLEFDDEKYLWRELNEEVVNQLQLIEITFKKIDDQKLHEFKDLGNALWGEVRVYASRALELLEESSDKGGVID